MNRWVDLAAQHRKASRRSGGNGTWTLTLPNGRIVATQCLYLANHPYGLGGDAWRISVQIPGDPLWIEIRHQVCGSEQEAISTVRRLEGDTSTFHRGSSR